MLELVILADDFTGALDTGVQFSKKGIRTMVTEREPGNFVELSERFQVLVINLESRHIEPEQASIRVYQTVKRAREAGVQNFYKKTDSGLRGNIGSELAAVVQASGGEPLPFIPAFPDIRRITKRGRHYIEGIPVSRSVYGKDPFEPVQRDRVSKIIKDQVDMEVIEVTAKQSKTFSYAGLKRCIVVYDAICEGDMERIRKNLSTSGRVNYTAGCAGFAGYLPRLLKISSNKRPSIEPTEGLIVISGSVNKITIDQINYAAERGFPRITLNPEEKLAENILEKISMSEWFRNFEKLYSNHKKIILDVAQNDDMLKKTEELAREKNLSSQETRRRIAKNIAVLVDALLKRGYDGNLAVFGGDTLHEILCVLGCSNITPIGEIDKGIVFSQVNYHHRKMNIISKSGGFGKVDSMMQIERVLSENKPIDQRC